MENEIACGMLDNVRMLIIGNVQALGWVFSFEIPGGLYRSLEIN